MIVRELINLIGFEVSESQLQAAERRLESSLDKMESFAKKGTMFLTAPFLAFTGLALKFAGDAQETANMFNQTFKESADSTREWAKNYATDLNKVQTKTEEMLATFQSMALGLNLGRKEGVEFSKELVQMTDDFGSFRNLADKEAFRVILSALAGSVQVFDKYGINLREAALEQELLNMGITTSVAKTDELQKVLARKNIIQQSFGRQGAIGDARRTMWQFTNAVRGARNQAQKLITEFGKQLIPVAEKTVVIFLKIARFLNTKVSKEMKLITFIAFGLAAAIPPLILGFTLVAKAGMVFVGVLKAISVAATVAGISVNLLLLKFLLIGAAIALAVAGVLLIIEEITLWIKGQDTLIEEFLGPWENISKKLESFFEPFLEFWDDLVHLIKESIDHISGFFTSELDIAALHIEELAKEFYDVFVKWGTRLFSWFEPKIDKYIIDPIKNLLGLKNINLDKFFSIDNPVINRLTGASQLAESLQNRTSQTSNNSTVNNQVTIPLSITVPEGSTEKQKYFLGQAAKSAVDAAFQGNLNALVAASSEGK